MGAPGQGKGGKNQAVAGQTGDGGVPAALPSANGGISPAAPAPANNPAAAAAAGQGNQNHVLHLQEGDAVLIVKSKMLSEVTNLFSLSATEQITAMTKLYETLSADHSLIKLFTSTGTNEKPMMFDSRQRLRSFLDCSLVLSDTVDSHKNSQSMTEAEMLRLVDVITPELQSRFDEGKDDYFKATKLVIGNSIGAADPDARYCIGFVSTHAAGTPEQVAARIEHIKNAKEVEKNSIKAGNMQVLLDRLTADSGAFWQPSQICTPSDNVTAYRQLAQTHPVAREILAISESELKSTASVSGISTAVAASIKGAPALEAYAKLNGNIKDSKGALTSSAQQGRAMSTAARSASIGILSSRNVFTSDRAKAVAGALSDPSTLLDANEGACLMLVRDTKVRKKIRDIVSQQKMVEYLRTVGPDGKGSFGDWNDLGCIEIVKVALWSMGDLGVILDQTLLREVVRLVPRLATSPVAATPPLLVQMATQGAWHGLYLISGDALARTWDDGTDMPLPNALIQMHADGYQVPDDTFLAGSGAPNERAELVWIEAQHITDAVAANRAHVAGKGAGKGGALAVI